jgi:hypothetical protein
MLVRNLKTKTKTKQKKTKKNAGTVAACIEWLERLFVKFQTSEEE